MATRNFVDKNRNSWEWVETPETIEALKQLHETVKKVNLSNSNEQKSTDT